MEKLNISALDAERYIKEGLNLIGVCDISKIISYVNHEGKIKYEIYYEKEFRGIKEKYIKPLAKKEVVALMFLGLSLVGYMVDSVNIEAIDDVIYYSAFVNIASYGNNFKRNRRRK